jgi:ketosteroid isomerase-like protein
VDDVTQRGDAIVVALSWLDKHDQRHRWSHVLRLRDGRIVSIQDYATPRAARAAVRLRRPASRLDAGEHAN